MEGMAWSTGNVGCILMFLLLFLIRRSDDLGSKIDGASGRPAQRLGTDTRPRPPPELAHRVRNFSPIGKHANSLAKQKEQKRRLVRISTPRPGTDHHHHCHHYHHRLVRSGYPAADHPWPASTHPHPGGVSLRAAASKGIPRSSTPPLAAGPKVRWENGRLSGGVRGRAFQTICPVPSSPTSDQGDLVSP